MSILTPALMYFIRVRSYHLVYSSKNTFKCLSSTSLKHTLFYVHFALFIHEHIHSLEDIGPFLEIIFVSVCGMV